MTSTQQTSGQNEAEPGKRSDAGTVRVSRTVPAELSRVWDVLVAPAGVQALLGTGAELGRKGDHWTAADGSTGVLRSYHPQEQLRVTWHPDAAAEASLVEVDLREESGATVLDLRHDRVPSDLDAQALADRWSRALEAVERAATNR